MTEQMSTAMQSYFLQLQQGLDYAYALAQQARSLGFDPEKKIDIKLAKNMAERVEGLISVVAPQLIGSGVTDRIIELEKEYTALDWRVALRIAVEVAEQKFCTFKDKKEAIEVGIRTGFAYQTGGIVSAPLEGFIELKIKKRADGKEYFAPCYAGPIRGAGGTAAAFSLLITDYVRVQLGYATYDPTEKEIGRYKSEIYDYHERVTNLQYLPSHEEIEFLMRHLPIEIDGDPTEQIDVSNYKDIERIGTNKIRGGMCLVLAEGLSQKSPKLWKRLEKWGKEFSLSWEFLGEFLALQKEIKSKKKAKSTDVAAKGSAKLTPNYTFIADLVAGRPVLTQPMTSGGFRLRYGRTRMSGFSAAAIHPATMVILDDFIAIGTQLKVERPGKAAAITPCSAIDGCTVLLQNGSVQYVTDVALAKKIRKEVKEIIYLGDILFNFGDFSENGHILAPPGYCEEWWIQEFEQAIIKQHGSRDLSAAAAALCVDLTFLEELFRQQGRLALDFSFVKKISEYYHIFLYPTYTYYWSQLSLAQLQSLLSWLEKAKILYEGSSSIIEKIVFPFTLQDSLVLTGKRALELLGIEHLVVNQEFVVIEKKHAEAFLFSLGIRSYDDVASIVDKLRSFQGDAFSAVQSISLFSLRDKAGTFIGCRMGRPEKAKMRKLTGSPHVLFPVGDEGGRLRSFQEAHDRGAVTADFPCYFCQHCKQETLYSICEQCSQPTEQRFFCSSCGKISTATCSIHGKVKSYASTPFPFRTFYAAMLKKAGYTVAPAMIKGVRGTANKDHIPEHFMKGILRAKHDVYVNKDGTIRFDMSEVPLTHFKPCEVGVSVVRLRELGYLADIHQQPLVHDDQILELKVQDLVVPAGESAMDDQADKVLVQTARFVDDLLVTLYNQQPFYRLQSSKDLVGHLVVALAPHISAGMIGRIIGFSKTQAMLAHPLFHASLRRDCFVYETLIPIFEGNSWRNVKIGELVEQLNPQKIVDNYDTTEIKVKGYKTLGLDSSGKMGVVRVNNFTRHKENPTLRIKTASGRLISTTMTHRFLVKKGNIINEIFANNLKKGDSLLLPTFIPLSTRLISSFNFLEIFSGRSDIMIRGIKKNFYLLKASLKKISRDLMVSYHDVRNFYYRDSFPLSFLETIAQKYKVNLLSLTSGGKIAAKRDTILLPLTIPLTQEFMEYLGLYVAEGYSRYSQGKKGLAQVYVAAFDKEIRNCVITFGKSIGLKQSEQKNDRITFSSRIWYEFITQFLHCGSTAYKKRVPSFLFGADLALTAAFLRGYFEGDGSVSKTDIRVSCDSVSKELLQDIHLLLLKLGIFSRFYEYTQQPGPLLRKFYQKKGSIPQFTITKLTIPSNYVSLYQKHVGFITHRKNKILRLITQRNPSGMRLKHDDNYIYDPITEITFLNNQVTYCLNVENHVVLANGILTKQCDGDEASISLLLDALLNFSSQYLPNTRGAKTMDAPLVLTSKLVPSEVDDQALGIDVVWQYPLSFYEAALQYKNPWEAPVEQLNKRIGTPLQYEGMGYTHPVSSINDGVACSSYKSLPSMEEKLKGQMGLAMKIRAVEPTFVASMVINKHFLKDTKGNLRKFSQQSFRCVQCNEIYRRPPLLGKCTACGGRLLFTVSQGSIIKYLEPSISLAREYHVSPYLVQTLEILKRRVEGVFGRDKEKQEGLGKWFG